jgi:hypothetical protein
VTGSLDGHESFGPYCGCRYVGRSEGHGDVEVWLLYDGQPHAAGVLLVGLLYGRIAARGTDRIDHWIARPHRPNHQGSEVKGPDRDTAARKLWQALNGGNAAAVAAPAGPGVDCGGGCGAPAVILNDG